MSAPLNDLMMNYPLTLTHFFERSRRLFAKKTLATRVPGHPRPIPPRSQSSPALRARRHRPGAQGEAGPSREVPGAVSWREDRIRSLSGIAPVRLPDQTPRSPTA
mgnify:CR=1 FL=1